MRVATLARAFRCSVAEVKAMSIREVRAMTDVLESEARAEKRARARLRRSR